VTYAYALGNSLNVPAVKTLYQVGVAPFLDFLHKQLSRLAPTLPVQPKTADEVGLSLAL
jgi:membrane carboxypeptidase/penicillin-binding protein PbpC